MRLGQEYLPQQEASVNETLEGDEKTTYRVLGRIRLTERGIPYQSRDSRERSARSTLSRGKPGTRGRGTETIHTTTQRGA
jgi:hypothetical protein